MHVHRTVSKMQKLATNFLPTFEITLNAAVGANGMDLAHQKYQEFYKTQGDPGDQ